MPKTNMVPIKVILTRNAEGQIDWPSFNDIPAGTRQNMVWSKFIDSFGIGWHYDKVENLGTGADQGAAATLVPKAFADAAIATFPSKVSQLTQAEWESFWDERSHVYEEEEEVDTDALDKILKLQQLEDAGLVALTPQQKSLHAKALDPAEHEVRGRRKNNRRFWKDHVAEQGITFDPSVPPT